MTKKRTGLLEAKKTQTPDYSMDRWVKMASDLGDNVNAMVGHGEEEEKKLDDKAKKAKAKPEPKKPEDKAASKKSEPTKSASVKSEPAKPATRPTPKKPEVLSPPDFIKKEEDKKQKKVKEGAWEALRKLHQDKLKEAAAKLKAKTKKK